MRSSDKHYNDLGGIDSRTNPLTQNPKFARGGTNFAYSYRDELMKRRGFQKKIPASGCEAGLMEYKFTDINTGESRTEILGVGADGNLNRLKKHFLELTKAGGTVDSYSLFYDDTGTPSWKIVFYDSSDVALGTVSFPETDTLLDLAGDINALALSGLTADVVDEDGTTVVSTTCLAYTLDTTIAADVATGTTLNPAWYWERVLFADGTSVPFTEVVAQANNPAYEGPTWVNINNAIYITDGKFPMKYDGKAVYRAGMPKVINPFEVFYNGYSPSYSAIVVTGFSVDAQTTPTGVTDIDDGTYRYSFRYGFRDFNGAVTFGEFSELSATAYDVLIASGQTPRIVIPGIVNGPDFPVFGCVTSGGHVFPSGAGGTDTITVSSGHTVRVGMSLMLFYRYYSGSAPTAVSTLEYKYWIAKVSAVTSTTITIDSWPISRGGDGIFAYMPSGSYLNAYYAPDSYEDSSVYTTTLPPEEPFGAFAQVWRSTAGVADNRYFVANVPVPYISANSYNLYDSVNNSSLSQNIVDATEGKEIPRACRYLSQWQDTIIQAGRPYDAASILAEEYPSARIIYSSATFPYNRAPLMYTEANLCDFQSVFWASPDAPEGFPQDGLHEFRVATKFNDEIRGMIGNKDSFFVFKERSTGYLTGSLPENDLALEILEADVGTVCHKVLQEVQGAIFFMDQIGGFWSVVAGRLPVFIGYGIETEFRENSRGLNFRKAVATNFRFDDKYICHVPGDSPVFFTFDYASLPAAGTRSAWLAWTGVNGNGGVLATADDELLVSSGTSDVLWKQKFTNTKYDFSDHVSAVSFNHLGAWINFKVPVIDKVFPKVWINSIQGGFSLVVNQYMNYLESLVASVSVSFPVEGDKLAVKEYANTKATKVSAMSVGFENNELYEDVRIQGWEIEYSAAFDVNEGRQ